MYLIGLIATGIVTGLLGTLLGIGGGIFLVPILVLYFDTPIQQAIATGLVAVIANSNIAGSFHVDQGTVHMRLGVLLEIFTVLGALSGGILAAYLAPKILIASFSGFLALVSVLLWRKPTDNGKWNASRLRNAARSLNSPLSGQYFDQAIRRDVVYSIERLPLGLGVSFVAGNLSSLLGIGGGILKVPVLHLFCAMPMKAATATSNFMIGVTAATGAFLYFGRGEIEPTLTGAVALGVLIGSFLGILLNRQLKDQSVRKGFALLTTILSIQMFCRAIQNG